MSNSNSNNNNNVNGNCNSNNNRNRFYSENFQIKTLDESSFKIDIKIDPSSVKYNLESKK